MRKKSQKEKNEDIIDFIEIEEPQEEPQEEEQPKEEKINIEDHKTSFFTKL